MGEVTPDTFTSPYQYLFESPTKVYQTLYNV